MGMELKVIMEDGMASLNQQHFCAHVTNSLSPDVAWTSKMHKGNNNFYAQAVKLLMVTYYLKRKK